MPFISPGCCWACPCCWAQGWPTSTRSTKAQPEWRQSHYIWLVRSFWYAVIASVIAFALWFTPLGILIQIGTFVWMIYRVVRGWLAVGRRAAMA